MKIEKLNDNQIRCTLNKQDLQSRELKLSELAYGTEKAKDLFRDMMEQADEEFGFQAEDMPLMIEAIPVSSDCLVLIVTKVDDPDELDPRFAKFTQGDEEGVDLLDELMDGASASYKEPVLEGLDGPAVMPTKSLKDNASQKAVATFVPFAEALSDVVKKIATGIQKHMEGVEIEFTSGQGNIIKNSESNASHEASEKISVDEASEKISVDETKVPDEKDMTKEGMIDSHVNTTYEQIIDADEVGAIPEETDALGEEIGAIPEETDALGEEIGAIAEEDGSFAEEMSANVEDEKDGFITHLSDVIHQYMHNDETKEDSTETPDSEEAAELLLRVFSFESWEAASYAVMHLTVGFEGESRLYKDEREGMYYLMVAGYPDENNHLYTVTNELADYGNKVEVTYSTEAYLKEHAKLIIKENAINILKEY